MSQISKRYKKLLDDIYYSLNGSAGAFSSARPLYLQAKKLDKSITFKIVQKYLLQNSSYLLHRRVLRKHERRSFLAIVPHECWAIDYVVYLNDKGSNNQKTYLLTVLDTFSKFAWARAGVHKSAEETLKLFKEIIEEARTLPKLIFSDQGKCIKTLPTFLGFFLKFYQIFQSSTFPLRKRVPGRVPSVLRTERYQGVPQQ